MSIVLKVKSTGLGGTILKSGAFKLCRDRPNQFELTLKSNGYKFTSYSFSHYISTNSLLDFTYFYSCKSLLMTHQTNVHAFTLPIQCLHSVSPVLDKQNTVAK